MLLFPQCDMATGMKAFFESLAQGPPKYMVFGGACQVVTEPIAEAVHFWKIVQVSGLPVVNLVIVFQVK